MGANAKAWREHRGKLLHEFAEHYPDSYKTVFGEASAAKQPVSGEKKGKAPAGKQAVGKEKGKE